jgi:hypothetical protein
MTASFQIAWNLAFESVTSVAIDLDSGTDLLRPTQTYSDLLSFRRLPTHVVFTMTVTAMSYSRAFKTLNIAMTMSNH